MWVKQLIGRQQGKIVEMPFAEAQLAIDNDTAKLATPEEIAEAGHQPEGQVEEVHADKLLEGYRIEPSEGGGFDIFDAGGVQLNEDPLHNHIVARDHAVNHARAMRKLPPIADKVGDGVEYEKMNPEQLRALVRERGLDDSKATKKRDLIALLVDDDAKKAKKVEGATNSDGSTAPDFDAMSTDQLKVIAADQKIDLTARTDRADILAAVKAGYKAPALITA
jgi:hypothetical protein